MFLALGTASRVAFSSTKQTLMNSPRGHHNYHFRAKTYSVGQAQLMRGLGVVCFRAIVQPVTARPWAGTASSRKRTHDTNAEKKKKRNKKKVGTHQGHSHTLVGITVASGYVLGRSLYLSLDTRSFFSECSAIQHYFPVFQHRS